MGKFLKKFSSHTEYDAAKDSLILPNVSLCVNENDVHYNPWVETRVVAKFNVTSTSSPTKIASATTSFSSIEIDGVELPSVVSAYTFDTLGEHTVKYTLTDPTSIGDFAFGSCSSLTSITILDSVTSIGMYAFAYCRGLTSIDIPSGVTNIGNSAFDKCNSITSINIPSGVTSIGEGAFHKCSGLISIVMPNKVTFISGETFKGCTSLSSCTIGSGVTTIASSAFQDCTSLTSITSLRTTAPTIQSDTFQNIKSNGTLYVPQGSSGYNVWMGTENYYLGKYSWTKVEQ